MVLGYAAVQAMVKGKAKEQPQMICVDGLFEAAIRPISECLTTVIIISLLFSALQIFSSLHFFFSPKILLSALKTRNMKQQ